MVKFTISPEVHNEDLRAMYPYVSWHGHFQYFQKGPGEEHYRLLAHLAKQCGEGAVVADIGTYAGHSAAALASANVAKVITYDIVDHFERLAADHEGKLTIKDCAKIEYRVRNCLEDLETLKDMALIVLDVDPHDGIQEKEIVDALHNAGYKGIVVCDDTFKNLEMRTWWATGVPEGIKKIDVSKFGHWSGTGILIFDSAVHDIEVVEQSRPPRPLPR
jgi:predicted O-methyltransferase YrrM